MARNRFWMGDLYGPGDQFEIQADDDVIDYLDTLPYVLNVSRNFPGQAYIHISRQYDPVEAWCEIYDALTTYVRSEDLLSQAFGESDNAAQ